MSLDFLERFLPLLTARTGLHVREKDRQVLARALEARLRESELSPDEYLRALERDASLSGEWKTLMPRLTNGESYFLRDKGQIALLRDQLLPDLIQHRKKERTLRVWSAGCSTGEEVYTLAMLISELLPRRAEWQVSILGTDINEAALEKARAGVYGAWAFRSVPDDVRTGYFRQTAEGLEIKPELRTMVKFAPLNLRGSGYPSRVHGLTDLDLILCRNVLIYFDREAVAHALRGFAATLRVGGYLLTGHAELAGHDPAPLAVRTYAESVAYERRAVPVPAKSPLQNRGGSTPASTAVTAPARPATPPASPLKTAVPARPAAPAPLAPAAARPAAPAAASPQPSVAPPAAVSPAAELCSAARIAANAARYDEAVKLCREAVAADAVNIEAYVLWAHVTDEQGNAPEAKNLWKKVIYLAPAKIEAYVELAALYEREADARRARQMRETALTLLRAPMQGVHAPADIAEREALTRHLEELLSGASGASAAKTSSAKTPTSQTLAGRRR